MHKLLIVDDEPRIRNGLTRHIPWDTLGFTEIRSASNGLEALHTATEFLPDLIITDIRMPGLDGLQLIAALEENHIYAHVIVISGYSDFTYAQQAIHYGVCEYILKPIQEEHLLESVRRIVRKADAAVIQTDKPISVKDMYMTGNDTINTALEFIDTHFAKDISLADVAEYTGVHPNYLSGLFTKICGKGFSRILVEYRIETAKKMLQEPGVKVYEVYERVGYSDYSWFSKSFKQVMGISPKQYIKQYHEKSNGL